MREAPDMQEAASALAAGRWKDARARFDAVLALEPSPEAMSGLGNALFWLGETDAAVANLQRAYAGFCGQGKPVPAAMAAVELCLVYGSSLGNHAAARGWMGRLARLVDQHDLVPMRGWLALCRAAHAADTADPAGAETHATEALQDARDTRDVDLELCALSSLGAALVHAGRVAEGTALLDEAMAGALAGEGRRPETVVFAGCVSITACGRALQFDHAVQWIHATETFTRRYGNPHLYTVCRAEYGAVLFSQGEWERAEQELQAALRIGRRAEPHMYGTALARLAELRIAQGRPAEAEELLTGYEDHPVAVAARARIHLDRGEAQVAAALLHRRIEVFGQETLETATLGELAAEAEIALGDGTAAAQRGRGLVKVGERTGCDAMRAHGERACGRADLAAGDLDGAREHLERALEIFTRLGLPPQVAHTHLLLARTLRDREPAIARAEAEAALGIYDVLGAPTWAEQASAFLRAQGATPPRRRADHAGDLTRREQEVLALLCDGLSNRQIGERLFLSRKTVEHHVRGLLTKLGVSNRTEAAAVAARQRRSAPE